MKGKQELEIKKKKKKSTFSKQRRINYYRRFEVYRFNKEAKDGGKFIFREVENTEK